MAADAVLERMRNQMETKDINKLTMGSPPGFNRSAQAGRLAERVRLRCFKRAGIRPARVPSSARERIDERERGFVKDGRCQGSKRTSG